MLKDATVAEIVILGAGFAGLATAKALERTLKPGEGCVTLISRDNFQLFTPMLPEVSSGGLEMRHIITPIRTELKHTGFVLGDVSLVDLEKREVIVHHPITKARSSFRFDHLVFALGSVTSTFNLPGVAENTLPLKTLEDAETLRNNVIATLELADVTTDPVERRRLLTYVVVGGGFTGVEAAGELIDLFKSIIRFYPSIQRHEISMVLLEAGKSLLPDLAPKMGKYSKNNLTKRGVDVILGDGVAGVDAHGLILASGRRIESETIVWSAGAKPTPLASLINVPKSRHGAFVVRQDFSIADEEGLWAIGDCAAIPTGEAGRMYPPTAQHAIREGPVLAANIVATIRGEETKPFKYTSMGSMASLGARRGVVQLPGDHVLTGFIAWFIWRAYYLSRLPGADRKVRVALDWFIGLIFPRDIAELRMFTTNSREKSTDDAGMKPVKKT
jgi:NADH dehydrogenase